MLFRSLGLPVGTREPEGVHPNDDVNRGQSSNDVFPTAMHVAAAEAVLERLLPAVLGLRQTLHGKSLEFRQVVVMGRTHLMDATPLTLGQEFGGWVSQLDHGLQCIRNALAHVYELAVGGTAVGTGLGAHPRFAELVVRELVARTRIRFVSEIGRAHV